ncbi:MAG: zinc ribbon domain-containing protein [Nitrospinae bacterium]|nr:zinc ribbon domain-containing protein [Nitrospinota bacterium]
MPMYEYVCKSCGHTFEKLTPLALAHAAQDCPKCGKPAGERVMSAPSLGHSATGSSSGHSCGSSRFG